jgi:hypothetical protein
LQDHKVIQDPSVIRALLEGQELLVQSVQVHLDQSDYQDFKDGLLPQVVLEHQDHADLKELQAELVHRVFKDSAAILVFPLEQLVYQALEANQVLVVLQDLPVPKDHNLQHQD